MEVTEQVIESDEYWFNPGWFASKEMQMFELSMTSKFFKTNRFYEGKRIVGGLMV